MLLEKVVNWIFVNLDVLTAKYRQIARSGSRRDQTTDEVNRGCLKGHPAMRHLMTYLQSSEVFHDCDLKGFECLAGSASSRVGNHCSLALLDIAAPKLLLRREGPYGSEAAGIEVKEDNKCG